MNWISNPHQKLIGVEIYKHLIIFFQIQIGHGWAGFKIERYP